MEPLRKGVNIKQRVDGAAALAIALVFLQN
jgi:hypothetical protein